MKSSFTLRWHHKRIPHWINLITLSILVLKNLNRYNTLQSLYTALDHQLQDGLMDQQVFDSNVYSTKFVGLEATNKSIPLTWHKNFFLA